MTRLGLHRIVEFPMKKKDFQAQLAPIVAEYRQRPYAFWRSQVGRDPVGLTIRSDDGTECCVEIEAFWDDRSDADVRVIFAIDDGGWRAFVPVTDSFIIAKDGTFVGEQPTA